MTTSITSNIRSQNHRTLAANNTAASTSVVLLPQPGGKIPGDLFYLVNGFSCVPSNTGTLTLISGNSTDNSTDKILWETSLTAGTRIDFTGEFCNTAEGDALKITTTVAIGKFTLTVEHK